MSTITAILEADADGTLHLPVPEAWRHGKVKVEAKLEPADAREESGAAILNGGGEPKTPVEGGAAPQPGCLKGFWMARDFDEPLEDFKEYME